MSVSVIDFQNAILALESKKNIEIGQSVRKKTQEFAFQINKLSSEYNIDPVHQATLFMAKAIDVIVNAGPLPADLDEQHARAKNLLQSVIRARSEGFKENVRIISTTGMKFKELNDELSI